MKATHVFRCLRAVSVGALALVSGAGVAAECVTGGLDQEQHPVIVVDIDLTDTVHKLLRVREAIPVASGPLTLAYPQWIPGFHSPAGRVSDLAGLVVHAAGERLDWHRDGADPYLFHLTVPPKVSTLDIEFQYLGGLEPGSGNATSSPQIVRVDWHTVVLYPLTRDALRIPVLPSVRPPEHWQTVTALDVAVECDGALRFRATSLETLIDSPLVSGAHVKWSSQDYADLRIAG